MSLKAYTYFISIFATFLKYKFVLRALNLNYRFVLKKLNLKLTVLDGSSLLIVKRHYYRNHSSFFKGIYKYKKV